MTRTDTVVRCEGMKCLSDNLGIVDAERFVSLILREPFDYTEWQRDLYNDLSVEELGQKAMEHWDRTYNSD
ncbi:hypothetical protein FACS1894187_10320 [Synergistales bacterium]|nr:hypothetical protein FACS1894187_10320 [Synergistales bacterium]